MSDPLRERLGRRVRDVWIKWAERQPNPKPSWLVPYDELPPEDQDADECIGMAIWADCVDSLQSELGELETLRAERDTANTTIKTLQAGVARRVYGVLYDEVRPNELILVTVDKLVQRLAEAEAAARFYARYYDGPAEALLCEEDRRAFMWIEENGGEP